MNAVNKKHILVIRLSAMGDVAMTLPILLGLTQQYPHIKITILTRGFFEPMFSKIPNVSVYEPDLKGKHKGVVGLYKLHKELKELKIDAIADLHNVLRSNILKFYFKKTSEIPFSQIDKGRSEKNALITNKKFEQLKTTHQRYADVFQELGFKINLNDIELLKKTSITPTTQKILEVDTKKWIGIAPYAAFKGKMYPLELMETVVSELNNTGKYKVILFGGGNAEKIQLDIWQNKYRNCINMTKRVSFDEELALISQLDLMLAMDSGNAHIAAIYNIPTVTIWGVTHPFAGFYPYNQNATNALLADRKKYTLIPTSIYGNKFPKGYEKVMETITPEMVLKKIEQVLR